MDVGTFLRNRQQWNETAKDDEESEDKNTVLDTISEDDYLKNGITQDMLEEAQLEPSVGDRDLLPEEIGRENNREELCKFQRNSEEVVDAEITSAPHPVSDGVSTSFYDTKTETMQRDIPANSPQTNSEIRLEGNVATKEEKTNTERKEEEAHGEGEEDEEESEEGDETTRTIKKLPARHNRGLMSTLIGLAELEVQHKNPEPLPQPVKSKDDEESEDRITVPDTISEDDYLKNGITQDMLEEAKLEPSVGNSDLLPEEIDRESNREELCKFQRNSEEVVDAEITSAPHPVSDGVSTSFYDTKTETMQRDIPANSPQTNSEIRLEGNVATKEEKTNTERKEEEAHGEGEEDEEESEEGDETTRTIKKLPARHNRGLMSTLIGLAELEVQHKNPEPLPQPVKSKDDEESEDRITVPDTISEDDYLKNGITQDMLEEAKLEPSVGNSDLLPEEIDRESNREELCKFQRNSEEVVDAEITSAPHPVSDGVSTSFYDTKTETMQRDIPANSPQTNSEIGLGGNFATNEKKPNTERNEEEAHVEGEEDEESEEEDETTRAIKKLPARHNRGLMSTLIGLTRPEVQYRKPEPLPQPVKSKDDEESEDRNTVPDTISEDDYLKNGITQDMLEEAKLEPSVGVRDLLPEKNRRKSNRKISFCKLCQVQTGSVGNFNEHLSGRGHKAVCARLISDPKIKPMVAYLNRL